MRDVSVVAEFPACVRADLVLFSGITAVEEAQFLFCSSHCDWKRTRLMGRAPSVYCFLVTFIFLNQLAIDFIHILLNTVPSDRNSA